MRKIMIGTPTYNGCLDVHYVDVLPATMVKGFTDYDMQIYPIYICYDSLVQRARNDLIRIAVESEVDDLVFIDSDMGWIPEDFFKLLEYDVDIVGGTYRKKTDVENYVVKISAENKLTLSDNNLVEVSGLGAGFLRLTKKAINALWDSAEEYTDGDKKNRMIFNIGVRDGFLLSEDIMACAKLRDLGFKIWLDPSITCTHTGIKTFEGNFNEWAKLVKPIIRGEGEL